MFLSFMFVPLLLSFLKVSVNGLTNEDIEALRLVVPVDSQEVDGDAGQHDGQADATHYGLGVQRKDEQEGPEDEVNHGPDKANLKDETKQRCVIININTPFYYNKVRQRQMVLLKVLHMRTLIGRCMLGCLTRRTICPATVTP